MEKCFVIQPFDKDKFDKRYRDTFAPAITDSGLDPYRVDLDPSVKIPIDNIERMIQESKICFAEISTDNPNVWYELGYAYACQKDVVLICSNERTNNYPFDIQHRSIIEYKTDSQSDYENLKTRITEKMIAFLEKSHKIITLSESPLLPKDGINVSEMSLLAIIMENQPTKNDPVYKHTVENEMQRTGFNKLAMAIGIRTLEKKGMIETELEIDWNGNPYELYKLSPQGENWLIHNQDLLQFKIESRGDDEIPF